MTEDWTNLSPMELVKKLNEISEPPLKTIDETQYPMTYEEFKQKMIELLIKDAQKMCGMSKEEVLKDVIVDLENDPDYLPGEYRECCERYDELKSKNPDTEVAENVFSDEALSAGPIYVWGTSLNYWLYMM